MSFFGSFWYGHSLLHLVEDCGLEKGEVLLRCDFWRGILWRCGIVDDTSSFNRSK